MAEIGLALPASLTDGQGLRISEEDLRNAIQPDESEDELGDEEVDDRIEQLRLRVERLSEEVLKLTQIVQAERD